MYVYVHVCMYVTTYVCMYVCMYAYVHVCMYVTMCVCMHVYAHVCIYVRTHYMHADIDHDVCMRVCVCALVCMYVTYLHITCTQILTWRYQMYINMSHSSHSSVQYNSSHDSQSASVHVCITRIANM